MALGLLSPLPGWAETGPRWEALTSTQQRALAPLQPDWSGIDAARKQKWLELAARFGQMPETERARVQQRMADWARLPPGERTRARQQFLEARGISADEREARWVEYQSLPQERRQQLAAQAQQRQVEQARHAASPVLAAAPQAKANTLPLRGSSPPQVVAPSVLQARPGATTTTVTARPHTAPFQQPGLPKIAATPDFVDPATLLPRRGAQAAARVDHPASAARNSTQ